MISLEDTIERIVAENKEARNATSTRTSRLGMAMLGTREDFDKVTEEILNESTGQENDDAGTTSN